MLYDDDEMTDKKKRKRKGRNKKSGLHPFTSIVDPANQLLGGVSAVMPGVTVTLSDGRLVSVPEATADTPVAALKGFLVAKTGIGYMEQRLVFAGVELKDDGKSLRSYGAAAGTNLHLLVNKSIVGSGDAAGGGGSGGGGGAADNTPTAVAAAPPTTPQQRHKKLVESHRRHLLGVGFDDCEVAKVLGTGCNGAVLDLSLIHI